MPNFIEISQVAARVAGQHAQVQSPGRSDQLDGDLSAGLDDRDAVRQVRVLVRSSAPPRLRPTVLRQVALSAAESTSADGQQPRGREEPPRGVVLVCCSIQAAWWFQSPRGVVLV